MLVPNVEPLNLNRVAALRSRFQFSPRCSKRRPGHAVINVALAYGFADIALRHKSQRTQAGSPASDQSRIWQVTGMVTHGRGIGPFEICTESRVWGSEVPSHAILVWRADQPRIWQVEDLEGGLGAERRQGPSQYEVA